MDDREAKLPRWASELIAELRQRCATTSEVATRELARLRLEVDLLRSRNDAIMELLFCAARGEHKNAKRIVEILDGYGLVLKKVE